MPLEIGSRLGSFEVLAAIGAGGMGEVYRARDSKLGREVALKVLPAGFTNDAERMARFQREAQVLAALNHPNIASIYGVEESGQVRALVMELVEGPTLADRIISGPVPVAESIGIARQMAEALEAAHEKGIVHRDLKPANVKLTPEGKVKVLDFGLAKALSDEAVSSDPMNSPTLTLAATRAGVILGTAAYMPPEQAKGKTVDRRADIWAFGVVLFEMLTGRRGYTGETAAETLAAVMKEELDWNRLPADTPPAIRRLLRRCLEKDPRRRLRDIGEARVILEDPAAGAEVEVQPAAPRAGFRPLPWALAGLFVLTTLVLAWLHFRESPPPERVLRYTVLPPEKSTVHSFAISPDGRLVAIAGVAQGKAQLWVRSLDALQTQALSGTDGAQYPFWSPDSRHIGFFAQGKMKRIDANGGPAQTLCDAPTGRGGSWNHEGMIVFAPAPVGGLQRVAAVGGVPTTVTKAKVDHRFPMFLPDGQRFLYVVSRDTPEKEGVYLGSLDGKENRRLMADLSSVAYVPPAAENRYGHLLFVRENTLMARPFDASRAQFVGDLFPVAEHISFGANNNFMPVTASENGVLLYQTDRAVFGSQIAWFDRTGKRLSQVGASGSISDLALSPDEKTVAYGRFAPGGTTADIWLHELTRGTETRFTFHASVNLETIFSPKGDRIAFSSNRGGHFDLFQKAASGAGQDEPLLASPNSKAAEQWSRDGRFIVYTDFDPKTKFDLWVLPVGEDGPGERKPVPFLQTEFNELHGQFSPDGHWMAYTSDESGQREIYVRPFPAADGKWKISTAGGEQPRWRSDGKELFFIGTDRKIMGVAVKAISGAKPSFEPGAPEALFESHTDVLGAGVPSFQYDVTRDGKRFLLITGGGQAVDSPLTVVVNWLAGVKK